MAAPLERQSILVPVDDLQPGSVQVGFPPPAEDHMVKRVSVMAEFIKLKAANPTNPDIGPKESPALQV